MVLISPRHPRAWPVDLCWHGAAIDPRVKPVDDESGAGNANGADDVSIFPSVDINYRNAASAVARTSGPGGGPAYSVAWSAIANVSKYVTRGSQP